MPEHCVDHFDKLLVKSMNFCKFLTILTEDLKIEEVWKYTKVIKSDIFQGFICYNPVRSARLAKPRRDSNWQVVLISCFIIFTWIQCLKHCFNICTMWLDARKPVVSASAAKLHGVGLPKFFHLKVHSRGHYSENLVEICALFWTCKNEHGKYKAEQPPSWNHIIIECQRTRNPLSLILIFSVIKARGVLKSDYYVEEDPVWLCMQQLAGEKSTSQVFCNLLFEHFQFWKSMWSTTPHYLWVFGKNQKCCDQSAVRKICDVIYKPHALSK